MSVAVIPYSTAGEFDPVCNRGIRNNFVVPDFGDDFVFGNHPVPILDQKFEQIKDLGLNGHQFTIFPEFELFRIKGILVKEILHTVFITENA